MEEFSTISCVKLYSGVIWSSEIDSTILSISLPWISLPLIVGNDVWRSTSRMKVFQHGLHVQAGPQFCSGKSATIKYHVGVYLEKFATEIQIQTFYNDSSRTFSFVLLID